MVKKAKHQKSSALGIKPATATNKILLRFSFKFFDHSDKEVCPERFPDGYTQTLMQRLRDLSSWTVQEFISNRSSALRAHPIEWNKTSRKDGFAHLNNEFGEMIAWQFSVSSNEHGRVHGLLIDDTFYIVWLDCNHVVYS